MLWSPMFPRSHISRYSPTHVMGPEEIHDHDDCRQYSFITISNCLHISPSEASYGYPIACNCLWGRIMGPKCSFVSSQSDISSTFDMLCVVLGRVHDVVRGFHNCFQLMWFMKVDPLIALALIFGYRQTCNIRCTLVGNKLVDHSDVVGASSVRTAPTTSSFST